MTPIHPHMPDLQAFPSTDQGSRGEIPLNTVTTHFMSLCPSLNGFACRYVRLLDKAKSSQEEPVDLKDLFSVEGQSHPQFIRRVYAETCSYTMFSVPSTFPLVRCKGFREGVLQGIDLSSIFAVEALNLVEGDKVLDLCCAPGTKLLAIADRVGPSGFVVGVDKIAHRLDTTIAVIKKYGFMNTGVLLADGREAIFNKNDDWVNRIGGVWNNWSIPYRRKRKTRAKRREARNLDPHSRSYLEALFSQRENTLEVFDKVLVDVECTHDGSLRHVEKFIKKNGLEVYQKAILDSTKLEHLYTVQKELLISGLRHCKKDGVVVYATCSLSSAQNESIVRCVLKEVNGGVEEKRLPFAVSTKPSTRSVLAIPVSVDEPVEGDRVNACRFEPALSGCSGLFVSCLRKC